MQWCIDPDSNHLRIESASEEALEAGRRAIERFTDSGHRDATTRGQRLQRCLARQEVDLVENLPSLAAWCHTSGARASGREPARDVATRLFGAVLPDPRQDPAWVTNFCHAAGIRRCDTSQSSAVVIEPVEEKGCKILAGTGAVIDRWLGIDASWDGKAPRYRHEGSYTKLVRSPPTNNCSALVSELLEKVTANWQDAMRRSARQPTDKNWRFGKNLKMSKENVSDETILEKRIARLTSIDSEKCFAPVPRPSLRSRFKNSYSRRSMHFAPPKVAPKTGNR